MSPRERLAVLEVQYQSLNERMAIIQRRMVYGFILLGTEMLNVTKYHASWEMLPYLKHLIEFWR